MKKKFVQTVFLSMAAVSMLTIAALAAPPVGVPSAEIGYTRQNSGYAGVGGQLMRLGIYYGSNGKSSVDLTTVLETASCWDIMMSTIILWCSPVQRAST